MENQDYSKEHQDCLEQIKAILGSNYSDYTKVFEISAVSSSHWNNLRYENENIETLFDFDENADLISSALRLP